MQESRKKMASMKEELDYLRLSKLKEQALFSKRNELEIRIAASAEEIEMLRRDFYTQDSCELNPDSKIENLIKEKEILLKEAKQNLREIDHLLDQTDEETETTIKNKEEDLAGLIVDSYPHEKAYYENLQKELEHNLIVQEGIQVFTTLNHHLLELIQNILEVRAKVRRNGIFSYIFGRSPTIQISQHLEAVNKVAAAAIDSLKHHKQSLNQNEETLSLLYEYAITLLGQLQALCETKWNFKKIDHSLTTLQAALKKLLLQIEEEAANLKSREKDYQKSLKMFIEKYCG